MALSQEHLDPSYASPKPSYVYVELPKALDDHLEPPVALDKHIEHLDALKYVEYSDTSYDLKTIYDLDDINSIDLTLDHTLYQILLLTLLLTTLFLPMRLTYNRFFRKLHFRGYVWYLRFGTWYIWHVLPPGHSPIPDCYFISSIVLVVLVLIN